MHTHPLTIALLAQEHQRRLVSDARSARMRRELRRITAAKRAQAPSSAHASARAGFFERHEHPTATIRST